MHTFLLVAEHESFSVAAARSNRSPSAVSMQIRDLELQLGISLFQRTTRRVELTADGVLLLDRVKKAMTDVEEGIDQLLEAVERRKGRIRMACSPSIAVNPVAHVLAEFQEVHPKTTVWVQELFSHDLLYAVRSQEIDFGVGPLVADAGDLSFEHVFSEPLCILGLKTKDIGHQDIIKLSELQSVPLIILGGMPAIYLDGTLTVVTNIQSILSKNGTFNIRCMVQVASTAVAMAEAGLGVCVIPRLAVPRPLPDRLFAINVCEPALTRSMGVYIPRGTFLSPTAQQLVNCFRRSFLELSRSSLTNQRH
jgi:DNA-binding transcriptional LysR family regulator